MKYINKILIANRGEIATRIIKAAKKLKIKTVAVYAKQDECLDFVKDSDESFLLKGDSIADTYLNADLIIEVAKQHNADAIHPGYGFLSENAEFARKCIENDIVFIGPNANTIEQMGNKIEAREIAQDSGIPVLPASLGDPDEILKTKNALNYPVLIKASAGGGGKGMKVVYKPEELEEALWIAKQQALTYFGNDSIYIERYLENPKHIEVQIFGDVLGNYVHLFERECSIQRRHQKIIEESPLPNITEELREKLVSSALRLVKKINYTNAGTVEFLVQNNEFYFLEMNARIQVEHPVTEEATGIDLVKEQILVAEGNPLSFSQNDIKINKHAIQCRIYAEDPENNFRPSPGVVTLSSLPGDDFCRIDTISYLNSFFVSSDFDPMLTKLITSGKSRREVIQKMIKALSHYNIHGIKNNVIYLREIFNDIDFIEGRINTKYIQEHHQQIIGNIKSKALKIPVVLPLLSTYLFLSQNGVKQPGIWNTLGRWRAIDIISAKINDENIRTIVLSKKDTSLGIYVDNQYADLHYTLDENKRLTLSYQEENYNCLVSRNKQNNLFSVTVNGFDFIIERTDILKQRSLDEYLSERKGNSSKKSNGFVKSPLNGKAIKVNFKNGDKVTKGDTLVVIESMKTENKIIAEHEGTISELSVLEGEQVRGDQLLLRLS